MINNYSLFYSYKTVGDVLDIVISRCDEADSTVKCGNIIAYYKNAVLMGYRLLDFSKIMKIKANGKIYLPSKIVIDIINSMLDRRGFENLSYNSTSGYLIGKVVEVNKINEGYIYSIDLGSKKVNSFSAISLAKNDIVTVATINTILSNKEKVEAYQIHDVTIDSYLCSEKELGVSESNDILKLDNDSLIGNDFFQMEE